MALGGCYPSGAALWWLFGHDRSLLGNIPLASRRRIEGAANWARELLAVALAGCSSSDVALLWPVRHRSCGCGGDQRVFIRAFLQIWWLLSATRTEFSFSSEMQSMFGAWMQRVWLCSSLVDF